MKSRILVVDDEEHVRIAFQTFLEDEGYEVVLAEDYASGLKALLSSRVDVVVSDIVMGGATGN